MTPFLGSSGGGSHRAFGRAFKQLSRGPSGTPSSLVATTYSPSQINLTWTNGDASSQTRIYRGVTLVHTAAAAATSLSGDTGLSGGTLYSYTAKHYKDNIEGTASSAASATTTLASDVWTTRSNLTYASYNPTGFGTYSAAICTGGQTDGTCSWDGSSWTTVSNKPGYTMETVSGGTQTSGVVFGGRSGGGYVTTNTGYTYNGSSWSSAAGTLPYSLSGLTGNGTSQNSVFYGGGTTNAVDTGNETNTSATYDGTSWTARGNMSVYRRQGAGAGTPNSGIVFGGIQFVGLNALDEPIGIVLNTSEHFNGTSWSGGGTMLNSHSNPYFGGAGSSRTNALAIGNYGQTWVERYDGSSWSSTASLNAQMGYQAGAGTGDAAISMGGLSYYSPFSGETANVETYYR